MNTLKDSQLETIGGRILAAREHLSFKKRRAISQGHLAKLCGWESGQSRIGNYEQNKRIPSPDDITRIASVTGVKRSWLMFGEGDMTEEDDPQLWNLRDKNKNEIRGYLEEVLEACDLAMKDSGRIFTDAERLEIYMEGLEFAGKKQMPSDLVEQYLKVIMKSVKK